MIIPGICSITFREKSPEEVIELVLSAGLKSIEWGADVHARPDELEKVKAVGNLTREAGLQVAGYGSYYLAFDKAGEEPKPFEPILAAAEALGAPVIRIWAGSLEMEKTEAYFETVVQLSREAAELAASKDIKVAYEFHKNTFTETLEGTLKLLQEVDHPNLYTLWQPPHGSRLDHRLREIELLADRLQNIHVFHWKGASKPPYPRLSLKDGNDLWQPCLDTLKQLPGDRHALLEFVRDNAVEQFREDAAALLRMINDLEK